MNKSKQKILHSMGIQTWEKREKTPKKKLQNQSSETQIESPILSAEPGSNETKNNLFAAMNWQELEQTVQNCQRCPLYETRTKAVFGVGNPHAKIVFVGEAPGANEDAQGEPFVGRAGKLLDNMLAAIDFKRQDIFITNVLKSRPPQNRDPNPYEIAQCTPFLNRQLELIQPRLMVALGRVSAHYLLQNNASLSELRSKLQYYGPERVPLLVTFHPAYLLRSPKEKARAYQDFLKIKQLAETL